MCEWTALIASEAELDPNACLVEIEILFRDSRAFGYSGSVGRPISLHRVEKFEYEAFACHDIGSIGALIDSIESSQIPYPLIRLSENARCGTVEQDHLFFWSGFGDHGPIGSLSCYLIFCGISNPLHMVDDQFSSAIMSPNIRREGLLYQRHAVMV